MINHTKLALCFIFLAVFTVIGCGREGASHRPTLDVPLEYADIHMPEDWWNDPAIMSEGRLLYQGIKKPFVNCAKCHGRDGKPVKRGAPDLTSDRRVRRFSDSYWFWRIKEGVPMTSMEGWDKQLSDQEIWKIIAYQKKFSMKGLIYDPKTDRWIDPSHEITNDSRPNGAQ